MIYVLTAIDGDFEGTSTTLLYADLDREPLEDLQARFTALAEKYKSVDRRRNEHMQGWRKTQPQPSFSRFPEAPKRPKDVPKKEWPKHPLQLEYNRQCGEHQKVHMEWNIKFTNESTRFFNEEMEKLLTAEDRAIYPKAAHHYNASFEVEEVDSPDELLAAVKAAVGSGTPISTDKPSDVTYG